MGEFRIAGVDEIRELDRVAIEEYGIPGIVLMENAGRGAAEIARKMVKQNEGRVLIVCGPGNNGGDGFVIGRHLHNFGIDVEFLASGAGKIKSGGDAHINFEIVKKMSLPVRKAEEENLPIDISRDEYCLVIDALLGTGLSGEARDPARGIIVAINESGLPVLAVDTPSGLDADSGEILGVCVKADKTATFAAAKKGFFGGRGAVLTGELHVVDIGAPRELAERFKTA